MPRRVLCKFFANGACLKGENCNFSHDWKAPANNICTYYLKGSCAFGSRCRYEHVRPSRPQSSGSYSSTSSLGQPNTDSASLSKLSAPTRPRASATEPAWTHQPGPVDFSDDAGMVEPISANPADRVLCSFSSVGDCPRGERCPHIHGHLCPTCGEHCLHPFRPDEMEEHVKACEKKQKHLEALENSQDIECCVCLERVLSKPTPAERKFGLLSECDHPFCISCIRNWRSSSPSSGMDVNSALRACPICRKLSYYVIPSMVWYSTKEEKAEIIDNYKAKLKSIDCKHFDFGNGTCPFGTSCFYKHNFKPGSRPWKRALNPYVSRSDSEEDYGGDGREDGDDDYEDDYEDFDTYDNGGGDENEIPGELSDIIDMALLMSLDELDQRYSGDYDEEDFLLPWQRDFLWSQLGYDMSDYSSDEDS